MTSMRPQLKELNDNPYIMEWDYVTIGQACFNVYAPGNFRIVKNKTGGDPHAIETMVENLK